jgi:hypothetical protein
MLLVLILLEPPERKRGGKKRQGVGAYIPTRAINEAFGRVLGFVPHPSSASPSGR